MDERRRLGYLDAIGIDVWVRRCPEERLVVARRASSVAEPASSVARLGEPRRPVSVPATDWPIARGGPDAQPLEGWTSGDIAAMDWRALEMAVAGCRGCPLCETRTQTVFGVGNRAADLMIVGEAPGAEEDRAGEPFVGRAGQLLNRMLSAIGLAREQAYIANVLKCRPPGNRDPRREEAERCEAYLMRQISLTGPRLILCVGRVAAQHLLETDAPVGTLRGRWFELGGEKVPLRVTYHPAYLLRSPEQKAKVWADLVAVAHRLNEAGRVSR
ncbi:MAG: uracil-DNA glycosylase [Thiocapsa sp.]|jgi:DNA polymerase|nr:uracil-DNA glycosylase [Thiocapsa sp.]MCG6896636.1 uracil-DNA glycosylase [Thiocapsa sp.]MCG6985992.1 uracil-DNA glycosylase [Thiocapsa sp.]